MVLGGGHRTIRTGLRTPEQGDRIVLAWALQISCCPRWRGTPLDAQIQGHLAGRLATLGGAGGATETNLLDKGGAAVGPKDKDGSFRQGDRKAISLQISLVREGGLEPP